MYHHGDFIFDLPIYGSEVRKELDFSGTFRFRALSLEQYPFSGVNRRGCEEI